jgi:hypothetical protein
MNAAQSDQVRIVNRLLRANGLPTLDQAETIWVELAPLVRDHDHFRSLLVSCQPEIRKDMYEALAPKLRFEAWPLDRYIAKAGEIAEREQLMSWDPEKQQLSAFKIPEVGLKKRAELAIAHRTVTMTCARCTKEESFGGATRVACIKSARDAGWVYHDEREYCPGCPKPAAAKGTVEFHCACGETARFQASTIGRAVMIAGDAGWGNDGQDVCPACMTKRING